MSAPASGSGIEAASPTSKVDVEPAPLRLRGGDVEQSLRGVDPRDDRSALGREQRGVARPAADVDHRLAIQLSCEIDDHLGRGQELLGDHLVSAVVPVHRHGL